MRLAPACVLVVLAARFAVADPAPELSAELAAEFQAGVDAFRLGQLDEARAHLEKARALDPTLAGPHRFLAAVARAQGRWQDCIDGARAALERNPQSAEAPETRTLHDECRASAGLAPYRGPELADSAAIAVTTNVAGAIVKIGGLTYGGTPLAPRPITAGELEIELAKPGWKPIRLTVAALPGIVTDVAIELEPDPDAQVGGQLEVAHVAKPTVGWLVLPASNGQLSIELSIDGKALRWQASLELAPGVHAIEVRTARFDPWRRRVRIAAGQRTVVAPEYVETAAREHDEHLGLGITAGAGALLVGGLITALVSEHAAADAREIVRVETARDPTQPLSATAAIEAVHTRADLDAARSLASTWGVVSDIALGAGLATAAVAAYYLYRGGRERADIPPPFAIGAVSGGAVLSRAVAW